MVALHNRKLNEEDIFPGVLWTDKEWHALQDHFRAKLKAEGVTFPEILFRTSRMMEDYQRTQPSMRERQEIMAKIYPPASKPKHLFTEEEIDWLLSRLDGVNDPIGQNVLEKLKTLEK